MQLIEPIETLNQRLVDIFGIDTITGDPNWRIVFSEDQYEKRLTYHTKEGFELPRPEMVELPKYKQWIHEKYLIEKLCIVPSVNNDDLVNKTSYEPAWVFEDRHGNYLPPKWEIAKEVIENVLYAMKNEGRTKYSDPESNMQKSVEETEKRIKAIEEALFGNESDIGDALATGNAVGYGVKK